MASAAASTSRFLLILLATTIVVGLLKNDSSCRTTSDSRHHRPASFVVDAFLLGNPQSYSFHPARARSALHGLRQHRKITGCGSDGSFPMAALSPSMRMQHQQQKPLSCEMHAGDIRSRVTSTRAGTTICMNASPDGGDPMRDDEDGVSTYFWLYQITTCTPE